MRNLVLQRWALIFLLVSRLVVGELGYAMPMVATSSGSEDRVMVAEDPAACPQHEPASSKQTSAHPSDHQCADATGTSGARDCCQTGECECPCLHVPCAALDPLVINEPYVESHRVAENLSGLMLQQLTGLFRPPA